MSSNKPPETAADGVTPVLTCKVCCEEIPPSEDLISDARDYVMYLCGLDCYAQWHEHAMGKDASGSSEKK